MVAREIVGRSEERADGPYSISHNKKQDSTTHRLCGKHGVSGVFAFGMLCQI